MLEIVQLKSWGDYEKRIQSQLFEETQDFRYPFCYRGHPSADWHLETTLERSMGTNLEVGEYLAIVKEIQPELEAFTDREWDVPHPGNYAYTSIDKLRSLLKDSVDYMKYLRHYGYPSPLLDWTHSPFVAAYFAFRDITNKAESVAIYELKLGGVTGMGHPEEHSYIYPIYGSSRKNRRHYLQQSIYTVCLTISNNKLCFTSHEDDMAIGTEEISGELITKYILPASERVSALHGLQAYNINAYSLFGTEESLLESLFLRDYKRREISKRVWPDEYLK